MFETAAMTTAPSKLTPDQWKRVDSELSVTYGHVELEIDGFRVDLNIRYSAPRRQTIVVFVNGRFLGKWLGEDCEERRRFFRPVVLRLYSHAKKADMIKRLGKKLAMRCGNLDATHTYWTNDWPSFGPLKRHLVKYNASIRLVAINGLGEPDA